MRFNDIDILSKDSEITLRQIIKEQAGQSDNIVLARKLNQGKKKEIGDKRVRQIRKEVQEEYVQSPQLDTKKLGSVIILYGSPNFENVLDRINPSNVIRLLQRSGHLTVYNEPSTGGLYIELEFTSEAEIRELCCEEQLGLLIDIRHLDRRYVDYEKGDKTVWSLELIKKRRAERIRFRGKNG